ncbi:chitin elicitor receptor kinase [Tanacetum coccineum]
MNTIQTFLKKFNRISFRETPKVLLLAWEKLYEIKHACREKQHQPEDLQELLRKLLEDLQIISDKLADYINTTNWNCPAFYEDDDDDEYTIQYREYLENSSNAITPDLPTDRPVGIPRYLKGALGMRVCLKPSDSFELTAFVDSDWSKCIATRSLQQYRAMSNVACEIIWVLKILTDLKVEYTILVEMFCDSTAAMQIAANPVSVSKQWKSLIDSSEFIKSYHSCKTHLFVKYWLANDLKYVSIADDDIFPNHIIFPNLPQTLLATWIHSTLTSGNGLFMFYVGSLQDVSDEKIAVLWNPSVGKTVSITISNSLLIPDGLTFIGFGVCPNTSDPKLVRINTIGFPTVLNWEVEVFTLSAHVWKTVSNIPPTFRTCHLTFNHVFVEGFIYWRAYDNIELAPGILSNMIISFDLKSDEFGVVYLPGRLVHTNVLVLSKVYESLGLFEYYYNDGETRFCDVWIMKEGVTKSFTKMLSIKATHSWVRYRVLELRKNGEVIIENIDDTDSSILQVYEPSSGRISGVGINGSFGSLKVHQYGDVSPKVDVYAFGVVLYELISAKEAIVKANGSVTESKGLVALFDEVLSQPDPKDDLIKIIDPRMGDNYPLDSVRKMAQLAKACTHENPQLRPSMRSIVVALMTLSSSTEDWDVGSFYDNQTLVSLMSGR